MIVLTLFWCLQAHPHACVKSPDHWEFDSVLECIIAAQEIGAEHLKPGYVLNFRCGPPSKEA